MQGEVLVEFGRTSFSEKSHEDRSEEAVKDWSVHRESVGIASRCGLDHGLQSKKKRGRSRFLRFRGGDK